MGTWCACREVTNPDTSEGRYVFRAAQGTFNRVLYAPFKSSSWSAPTKCPFTVRLPDPTPPSAFKAHGPTLSAYPLRGCPTSSGRVPIPESC